MGNQPRLSIVVPIYNSHCTIVEFLDALACQTVTEFEVILVDSGASVETAQLIEPAFPWVRYVRVNCRMLPHEARNHGIELATTDLIVTTDPDVYPDPDWLEQLLCTYRERGGVVVGAVTCFGDRWIDRGMHLAKFDMWLPSGSARPIEIAPTVNLLFPRYIFKQVGGFPGEFMLGDLLFCWRLKKAGKMLTFNPAAVVAHHHLSTWREMLQERFVRGREFGALRQSHAEWRRARRWFQLLVTVLPIRWVRLIWRSVSAAVRAGLYVDALLTLPLVGSGHGAWLLGECVAYLDSENGHG